MQKDFVKAIALEAGGSLYEACADELLERVIKIVAERCAVVCDQRAIMWLTDNRALEARKCANDIRSQFDLTS